MKKLGIFSLLLLALMLAACADGGAAQTPGALPTDAGVPTAVDLPTEAATTIIEPTVAATTAATLEATSDVVNTPEGQVTAEVESGIVAVPYSLFTVASLTGEGGTENMSTAMPVTGTQAAVGTVEAGTPMATTVAGEETGDSQLVRASELLGSEVVDMTNTTVGTVTDVLVSDAGAIEYVVVDAAAYLEGSGETIGEAATPAPLGTLDASTAVVGTIEPVGTVAAGTQPAGIDTPELNATSPAAEGTAMPETGAIADADTILVFNGAAADLRAQAIMLPDDLLDMDGAMLDVSGVDLPADMALLNGLVRISRITDGNANVLDAQAQDMGEVEDLLVELRQGMVQYGVVDFGGFLGIAENTVAVPWAQFTLAAQTEAQPALMLDVTQETLENAPLLDVSAWPAWPEAIPTDWETETRTFWETAS